MARIWRNFAAVVWVMLLFTLMCLHAAAAAAALSPEEGAGYIA